MDRFIDQTMAMMLTAATVAVCLFALSIVAELMGVL